MIVMKFGGTSVANINKIRNVASIVENEINGNKLVIVLSAMAGETNKMQQYIDEISSDSKLIPIKSAELKTINGTVIMLKILIAAVREIDNATSPFANFVRIFDVIPPGAAAIIITPSAISGDVPKNFININATIGKIIN